MKPFAGWYEASAWCSINASGECCVLTPGKRWWYCLRDRTLVFMEKIRGLEKRP